MQREHVEAIAGRRAFAFERLPLRGMTVALLEFRRGGGVRRRWRLRTPEEGFTIETEQEAGEGVPALERVMRLVLERADRVSRPDRE